MKRHKLLLIIGSVLLLLGITIDIVSAQDRLSIGKEIGFNRGGFSTLGQPYTGFSVYGVVNYKLSNTLDLSTSLGYVKSGSNNIRYKRTQEDEVGLVNYRFNSLSLRSLAYFNLIDTNNKERLVYKVGSGLMLNYSPDSWIDTNTHNPVDRRLNGTSTKKQFNLTNLFYVFSVKIESNVDKNNKWIIGLIGNYNIGLFDVNSKLKNKGLNSNLLFSDQRIRHNYLNLSLSLKYTI